jgi:DNA-directed RNA polymerase subunit M/transcription elongation factor TFIIS
MKNTLFCESCGKILNIKLENEKLIGKCICGFSKEIQSISFSEKNQISKEIGKGVFNEKESDSYYPYICEKCGHPEANAYDLGVTVSDEANILIYRCKKCGHIKRQADGTGNTH